MEKNWVITSCNWWSRSRSIRGMRTRSICITILLPMIRIIIDITIKYPVVYLGIMSVIIRITIRAIGEWRFFVLVMIAGRVLMCVIRMGDYPSAISSTLSTKVPSPFVEISGLRNVLWGCENPLMIIIWVILILMDAFIAVLSVDDLLLLRNFTEICSQGFEEMGWSFLIGLTQGLHHSNRRINHFYPLVCMFQYLTFLIHQRYQRRWWELSFLSMYSRCHVSTDC